VDGLIPATEYDARESVELFEAHQRHGVKRNDADNGRLDVWQRQEVVPAQVHDMVNFWRRAARSRIDETKAQNWAARPVALASSR